MLFFKRILQHILHLSPILIFFAFVCLEKKTVQLIKFHFRGKYNLIIVLTRALWGGAVPPLRLFADSGKTAARSAAKFGVPVPTSILHIVCKN